VTAAAAVGRLTAAYLAVALVALLGGVLTGLAQGLEHAGINVYPALAPVVQSYYHGLSLHGVLNVLLWTTFFICGFLPFIAVEAFGTPLAAPRLGWLTFWLMTGGLRDLSRQQHDVDARPRDEQPVLDVLAGGDERDGRAGRHPDLVGREGPDLRGQHDLVAAGAGLSHAGRVERRRLGDERRRHAPGHGGKVDSGAEGGHGQRRQHPDRDRDRGKDPRQLVQIDGGGGTFARLAHGLTRSTGACRR
jgi:hypothetical protein